MRGHGIFKENQSAWAQQFLEDPIQGTVMKKNPFIPFLIALALTSAAFSGCGDVDHDGEKSTEAELESLSVGGLNAAIPSAISGAMWGDTAQTLSGLAAKYTATIVFPAGAAMSGLAITPTASEKAKAEYASAGQPNTRPATFNPANTTATLNPPRYLYIKITAEDGKTVNYYRFFITQPVPATGITLDKDSLSLTIHSSEKLSYTMQPETATNRNVTWHSSDPDIVSVDEDGIATAKKFSSGGSDRFSNGGTSIAPTTFPATGTATITVTAEDGGFESSITVTATTEALVDLMELPPLKDKFADYFLIGNIFRGSTTGGGLGVPGVSTEVSGTGAEARIIDERLARHYNALTAENHMKPSYLVTGYDASTGTVTWSINNQTTADNFVDAANNSGMKVIGHTLLWHSQNAQWMTSMASQPKATALAAMKAYITAVVDRYKGKIYSWDVLNEAFPDNASGTANWKDAIRSGASNEANPWYAAIGSDFVYEGFKAARLADPNAILYYNDYNTDAVNRARLIRDMVQDVNQQWLSDPEYDNRLLIEGIGMQEHHNNGITAARIKAAIDTFRPLGVRLAVTELDLLAVPSYNDLGGSGANQNHNATNVTNTSLLTQARLYSEYMQVYLDNADIIERVALWGITDNTSWRSRGLPLLFDHAGKAKPAYYRFVSALDEFEQQATDE